MDKLDKATRSRIMGRSRSSGTKATEWRFRSLLIRLGISGWQLGHKSDITGRPDFVFRDRKLAIFVDGCFWHGCSRCRSIPVTNRRFWVHKINGNRIRDQKVRRHLKSKGWKVVSFWEHELKKVGPATLRKLAASALR